jgi:hypothetical protein
VGPIEVYRDFDLDDMLGNNEFAEYKVDLLHHSPLVVLLSFFLFCGVVWRSAYAFFFVFLALSPSHPLGSL